MTTKAKEALLIARLCHEANRAYCETMMDDTSQDTWAKAPQWQKDSAIKGVIQILENPDTTPEQTHESWLAEKEAAGWKYGPIKDPVKKLHPCFLPYAELPEDQQAKDDIFGNVVAKNRLDWDTCELTLTERLLTKLVDQMEEAIESDVKGMESAMGAMEFAKETQREASENANKYHQAMQAQHAGFGGAILNVLQKISEKLDGDVTIGLKMIEKNQRRCEPTTFSDTSFSGLPLGSEEELSILQKAAIKDPVGSVVKPPKEGQAKLVDGEWFYEVIKVKTEGDMENISDGYHTFKELYDFRLAYNALLYNAWYKDGLYDVHKSRLHHDGVPPFGKEDWFIVTATLPAGQISNHYEMKHWDKFKCLETEKAKHEWDGHTSADVLKRMMDML